jgi:diguanylate cyclase
MSNKQTNTPATKSPTDIARETFKRLAIERIAPTPDAYRKIYNDISGVLESDESDASAKSNKINQIEEINASEAENLLSVFAENLKKNVGELASFGHRFSRAVKSKNWEEYDKALLLLSERIAIKPNPNALSLIDEIGEVPAKISLVDANLLPDQRQSILKDLLFRTLSLALSSLLRPTPALSAESDSLAQAVKEAESEISLNNISARLKQLCFQIELKSGDAAEQQDLLLRLFALLLENVKELLDDDNWLRGQIDVIQDLISGPIDHRALQEATRSLKDVIYKQGVLKHRIDESKNSVKNMMATFIDRLDAMTASTEAYQSKMDVYSEKISHTQNKDEISAIIHGILDDTRTVQSEAMRSHDIMVAAQREVKESEQRIKELEEKLAHMSELVREDQLTGSLNRRGLDDVFEREADRADRRGTPLCAAMLDLDNFKKLNDTHGHAAGDEALIHLVKIVKNTLRSIDVIARYGGEEFLIVMPETTLEEAAQAMVRVQRELTTHFFSANDQRLFITFSAGVALREPHEEQDSVVKRADKAMYEAKKSGKNRVVTAA